MPKERININDAHKEKLQILYGIGPKTADKIIKHRTEEGPISSLEELKKVANLSDRDILNIEGEITFEQESQPVPKPGYFWRERVKAA